MRFICNNVFYYSIIFVLMDRKIYDVEYILNKDKILLIGCVILMFILIERERGEREKDRVFFILMCCILEKV